MIRIIEDTSDKIGCTDACVFLYMLMYYGEVSHEDVDLELRLEAFGLYQKWLKDRIITDEVEAFCLDILTNKVEVVFDA